MASKTLRELMDENDALVKGIKEDRRQIGKIESRYRNDESFRSLADQRVKYAYNPELDPEYVGSRKTEEPVKSAFERTMSNLSSEITRPREIFGVTIDPKPLWEIKPEDIRDQWRYTRDKFGSAVNEVVGSLNPLAIVDSAFTLVDAPLVSGFNILAKKFGWKEQQIKSLRKAVTDVVQINGGGKIDTTKITNPIVKRAAQDINDGVGVVEGMNKRTTQYLTENYTALEPKISKALKITTDVVNALPQSAAMFLPGGHATYAVSALNGALTNARNKGVTTQKDYEYAIMESSVQIVSELLFGLVDDAKAILPGSLQKLMKSAGKTPVTGGQIIWATMKQMGEESAEEMIAFPFSAWLEWQYKNPDKPWDEYNPFKRLDEWGYAGLIGFLAGGILSAPEAMKSGKLTKAEKSLLNKHVQRVLNGSEKEVTKEDVGEAATLIAKGLSGSTETVETPEPTINQPQDPSQTGAKETPETIGASNVPVPDGVLFKVEGTPLQMANLDKINTGIRYQYGKMLEANKTGDTLTAKQAETMIESLKGFAETVIKNPLANPMGVKPKSVSAPDTTPVAPTTTATTSAPTPTTPAPAKTGTASSGSTTQPRGKVTRADFPTYVEFLEHKRDAMRGRANNTQNENERRKLLGERIPEAESAIQAEREAMARGETTEVVKQASAPKSEKPARQPKPEPAPKPAKTVSVEGKPVTHTAESVDLTSSNKTPVNIVSMNDKYLVTDKGIRYNKRADGNYWNGQFDTIRPDGIKETEEYAQRKAKGKVKSTAKPAEKAESTTQEPVATETGSTEPASVSGNEPGASGSVPESVRVSFKSTKDTKRFVDAITKAVQTNSHGAYVEAKSVEEYESIGAKLFLSKTGTSGFALSKSGDLISLFKQDESTDADVLHESVMLGIKGGAKTLDCFAPYLPTRYAQYGFVPVARLKFNDNFAPENWNYTRDGRPDIVFMVHNGDSFDQVSERQGQYKKYQQYIDEGLEYVADYDTAKQYQKDALEYQETILKKKNRVDKSRQTQTSTNPQEGVTENDRKFLTMFGAIPATTDQILDGDKLIAKTFKSVFGVRTVFYVRKDESTPFGKSPKNEPGVVYVMAGRTPDNVVGTFGHESMHGAQTLGVAEEFMRTVADVYGIENYDDKDAWLDLIPESIQWAYQNLSLKEARFEGSAFVAAELFKKQNTWELLAERLGTKAPTVFTKFHKWISKLLGTKVGEDVLVGKMLDAMEGYMKVMNPTLYSEIKKTPSKGKAKATTETQVDPNAPAPEIAETFKGSSTFIKDVPVISDDNAEDLAKRPDVISGVLEVFPKIQRAIRKTKGIISVTNFDISGKEVTVDMSKVQDLGDARADVAARMNALKAELLYDALGLKTLKAQMTVARTLMFELSEYDQGHLPNASKRNPKYVDLHSRLSLDFNYRARDDADGDRRLKPIVGAYMTFSNTLPKINGSASYSVKIDGGNRATVIFTTTRLTDSVIEKNNLAPIIELRDPSGETVGLKAPARVQTPETKASNETVSYPDAKINVIVDTKNKKYTVLFDSYIDEERTRIMKKHDFKYYALGKSFSKGFVEGQTVDNVFKNVVNELAKVEKISAVETIVPSKETTSEMFSELSVDETVYEEMPVEEYEASTETGEESDPMKNIHDARTFKAPKDSMTRIEKVKEFLANMFGRGAVPMLSRKKYGQLRAMLIQNLSAKSISASMAELHIAMYNNLNSAEYSILSDYLVLMDLQESLANPNRAISAMNPWGFTTIEQVREKLAVVKSNMNSATWQVYEDRKEIMNGVRNQYSDLTKKLGYDANKVLFTHSEYLHHSMENLEDLINTTIGTSKYGIGSSWIMEQRNNAPTPYLTDPALSDFITMHQMFLDIKRMELLLELKTYDRSKDYKPGTKLPRGLVESDMGIVGFIYPEDAIKSYLGRIANEQANFLNLTGETRKKFIEDAKKVELSRRLVLPEDVAVASRRMMTAKEKSDAEKAYRTIMRVWKGAMIKWPHRIVNYNVKNFAGDFDAMLAAYPGATKYIAESFRELKEFYSKTGTAEDLVGYIWKGGMTTGLAEVELKNFQKMPEMKFYTDVMATGDQNKITEALRKVAGKRGFLDDATQFREQLLRYATYKYLLKEGIDKESLLPVQKILGKKTLNFGASNAKEIMGLKTIEDIAYKLSNDALGAYNDVSMFGSFVSDHMIPFFRFKEINLVRYWRLLRNTMFNDQVAMARAGIEKTNRIGLVGKVLPTTALRIGRLLATGSIVTLLQLLGNSMWNLWGEDEPEKDLPSYIRSKIHLYLGAINGRSYYMSGLGSIADLYDFFGVDTALEDYSKLASGQLTLPQYIGGVVKTSSLDFLNSMHPLVQLLKNLASQTTNYPETRSLRGSADVFDMLMSSFGFGDIAEMITKLPDKQMNVLQWVLEVANIGSSAEREYNVYWQARDKVNEYLSNKGVTPYIPQANVSPKGNAIYYFKEAVRLGDKKSARAQLAKYVLEGGNRESYNQSMKTLDPLNQIKGAERQAFLESLSDAERRTMDRAIALYEKMILEGEPIADEAFESGTTNGSQGEFTPSGEFDSLFDDIGDFDSLFQD